MYIESVPAACSVDDLSEPCVDDAQMAESIPVGSASELTIVDLAALLGRRWAAIDPRAGAVADADAVFVESVLREAAKQGPIRCSARLTGKVEFRAGEGPLFEIGATVVDLETSWSGALLTWADDDGRGNAALPLISFCLHLIPGNLTLQPAIRGRRPFEGAVTS